VLGAGTVINPIIKVVTAVAILAAVGIFIVRPVLDTTDKAINSVSEQVHEAQQQSQQASSDAEIQSVHSRISSYASSLSASWPAAAREARSCAHKAGDDLRELNVCLRFAQRLVTRVQSDRSFALSYATSLSAQGDTAGAQRVEQCVKDAGFETAAMQRCRNLADDLLFG
jgi:hypothetical protein